MRRAVVFLALGPLAVATIWLIAMSRSGFMCRFDLFFAAILFIFTMTVSAVVGLFDGYLEHALSIFARACLTGAAGAIVAYVLAAELVFNLFGTLPSSVLTIFAYGGAAYAGVCSLLANDRAWARTAGGKFRRQRNDRNILSDVR